MRERNDVTRPAVSVIMTFFDTPRAFFDEAVASVEAQTFPNWELILVNDGSKPDVVGHANALAERSQGRIRCISHPDGANHGTPASRNLGVRHARGDFLAFLDSDDLWLPSKLEEQVAVLDARPELWMVFGRSIYWTSWTENPASGDHTPALGVRDGTVFQPPAFLHAMLRRRVVMPCPSSVLVRTPAVKQVGGFDEAWPTTFEDQTLYVKIGLHGPVLAMDRVWVRYRIHQGSVMQRTRSRRLRAERQQFLDWILRYANQHGHTDAGFRRTMHLERMATNIPGGQRLLRFLRRVSALPGRISTSRRG